MLNTQRKYLSVVVATLISPLASAAVINDGAVALLDKVDVTLTEDSTYGPYAAAMGTTGTGETALAVQSLNFDVNRTLDIGDPSTLQNGRRGYSDWCPFDSAVCDSIWFGREGILDGARSWRQNETGLVSGEFNFATYTPHRLITLGTPTGVNLPFSAFDGMDPASFKTDNHVRRFYYDMDSGADYIASSGASPFTNEASRERTFQRRALVTGTGSDYVLLPNQPESFRGGFSDVFDIKRVGQPGGSTTQLIALGQASVDWGDDANRFDRCYRSGVVDSRTSYNELVNCPGIDTQAAWWSLDGAGGEVPNNWLVDRSVRRGYLDDGDGNLRTAAGRSVNKYGVAVGFSTIKRYSFSIRSHRASVFAPTFGSDGQISYVSSPVEIFQARQGFDDEERKIFHTDAQFITDTHFDAATGSLVETDGITNQNYLIAGTRIHAESRNMNRADEFWVYEYATKSIRFPLFDTMVDGARLTGANSRVTGMNNQGLISGYGDGLNQAQPTQNGSPRVQRGFIYDYKTNETFPLDSLICYVDGQGAIQQPRVLLTDTVGITEVTNDQVQILATGFEYQTDDDYLARQNSTAVLMNVTVNLVNNRIDKSAILDCSQSALGQRQQQESTYKRRGAGTGLGILALLSAGLWWRRRTR